MSRYFYLTCASCDPAGSEGPGYGYSLNWQGDALLALIPKLPTIARFYRETGLNPDPAGLNIGGVTANPLGALGEWAAQHDGHAIRVRDEYGAWWPETTAQADLSARAGRAVMALLDAAGLEGEVEISGNAVGDIARIRVLLDLTDKDVTRLVKVERLIATGLAQSLPQPESDHG